MTTMMTKPFNITFNIVREGVMLPAARRWRRWTVLMSKLSTIMGTKEPATIVASSAIDRVRDRDATTTTRLAFISAFPSAVGVLSETTTATVMTTAAVTRTTKTTGGAHRITPLAGRQRPVGTGVRAGAAAVAAPCSSQLSSLPCAQCACRWARSSMIGSISLLLMGSSNRTCQSSFTPSRCHVTIMGTAGSASALAGSGMP